MSLASVVAVAVVSAHVLSGGSAPASMTGTGAGAPPRPAVSADGSRFEISLSAAWVAQLTPQQADCSATSTAIRDEYRPGPQLEIPVVVHIITDIDGSGDISDETVQDRIEMLNQRFLASTGGVGEGSVYTGIRFALATIDPDGIPTTGITRTEHMWWHINHSENEFKTALSWDTNQYLNIYALEVYGPALWIIGYTYLPQQGVAGTIWDGVVIDNGYFVASDGALLAHLVGHFLGLYNTFSEGCGLADAPGCYTSGDLLCDTSPDGFAADYSASCDPGLSCNGYPALIDNYMQHNNTQCSQQFTIEQRNRMRCSLLAWREELYHVVTIFEDGFETGDTSAWFVP